MSLFDSARDLLGDDDTDTRFDPVVVSIKSATHLLKNERRRLTLDAVAGLEDGETVALGALAERLAARELGCEPDELGPQQRKRVYVGLYQCHLPKLDDAGALAWDKHRGEIARGENTDAFAVFLQFLRRHFGGGVEPAAEDATADADGDTAEARP